MEQGMNLTIEVSTTVVPDGLDVKVEGGGRTRVQFVPFDRLHDAFLPGQKVNPEVSAAAALGITYILEGL
jgi:hypothetical protein